MSLLQLHHVFIASNSFSLVLSCGRPAKKGLEMLPNCFTSTVSVMNLKSGCRKRYLQTRKWSFCSGINIYIWFLKCFLTIYAICSLNSLWNWGCIIDITARQESMFTVATCCYLCVSLHICVLSVIKNSLGFLLGNRAQKQRKPCWQHGGSPKEVWGICVFEFVLKKSAYMCVCVNKKEKMGDRIHMCMS